MGKANRIVIMVCWILRGKEDTQIRFGMVGRVGGSPLSSSDMIGCERGRVDLAFFQALLAPNNGLFSPTDR